MSPRLVVGVTGASGALLASETLRLLRALEVETHLVVTRGARLSILHELGADGVARIEALAGHVHAPGDLAAPIASGSFRTSAMIVVPCSMRSLAAIAHGLGDNLLTRAADVTLKEKRRLVVAPREAPLHEGHLESMLKLARLGAVIAPPVPPFYTGAQTVEAMAREIAARLVDWAGIDPGPAMTRWTGGGAADAGK